MDTRDVQQLVKKECPDLLVESIKPLNHGWYNYTFLINETIVIRIPKRHSYNIKKEWKVLELLENTFTTPIPKCYHTSANAEFLAVEYVKGFCATTTDFMSWSETEKKNTAKGIARFLSELHGYCKTEKCTEIDIDLYNYSKEVADIAEEFNIVQTWSELSDDTKIYVQKQAEISTSFFLSAKHNVLVHNDLHIGNIVFSKPGNIAGFIDFDAVKHGDRTLDFALIGSTMGWDTLIQTIAEYQTLTGISIDPFIAWAINVDYLISLTIKSIKCGELNSVPLYIWWLNTARPEKTLTQEILTQKDLQNMLQSTVKKP